MIMFDKLFEFVFWRLVCVILGFGIIVGGLISPRYVKNNLKDGVKAIYD